MYVIYCHQSIRDQKSCTDWALKKLLTFFLVKIFLKLPPLFKIPGSAPEGSIIFCVQSVIVINLRRIGGLGYSSLSVCMCVCVC